MANIQEDIRQLRNLIRDNEFMKFFEKAETITSSYKDQNTTNLVSVQRRYNENEDQYHKGIISSQEYSLEKNKITEACLKLIEGIENQHTRGTQRVSHANPHTASSSTSSFASKNSLWITGLAMLLLIVGLIILLPEPSDPQFFVFRLILALAAAGFASIIPGILKVGWSRGITATGAVAIFVIVYFFNPQMIQEESLPSTTIVSVFVHGTSGIQDIVANKNGSVMMDVRKSRKEAFINPNGQALFEDIYIGDTIRLNIKNMGDYQIKNPDTFYIVQDNKPIYLEIKKSKDNPKGTITPKISKPSSTPISSSLPSNGISISNIIFSKENLDINIPTESWCYDNKIDNCNRFGRLYTWDGAKKACASLGKSWRLPKPSEWQELSSFVVKKPNFSLIESLKEAKFSFVLGGIMRDGQFVRIGKSAFYWTTEEQSTEDATIVIISENNSSIVPQSFPKSAGASCRCVYDGE